MAAGLFNATAGGLLLGVVLGIAMFALGIGLCVQDQLVPGISTGILGLPVIYLCMIQYIGRFITAEPNEWILLIENGVCLRAGVGMQIFKQIGQVVVKFPSAIHKVTFRAEQVTKEMAGVQVQGFAIWSINREADGPSKAYKYLDGLTTTGKQKADENMAQMAEAIIRHQIANMSIDEVLTKREMLRNKAKEDMVTVAQGWGIWIETVEITDVRISSSELFNNMQCKFKQENRLAAQHIRLQTEKEINDKRALMNLETAKKKAETDAARDVYQSQQRLKAERQKEAIELERLKIRQDLMQRDQEMKRFQLEQDRELDKTRDKISLAKQKDKVDYAKSRDELGLLKVKNELEAEKARDTLDLQKAQAKDLLAQEKLKILLARTKREGDLSKLRALLDEETMDLRVVKRMDRESKKSENDCRLFANRMKSQQSMSETNMRFATLEAMQNIYEKIPIKEIKSVNINQGSSADPTGMLTGLMTVLDNARGQVRADVV